MLDAAQYFKVFSSIYFQKNEECDVRTSGYSISRLQFVLNLKQSSTHINKIFSGYKKCQPVKDYPHITDHLCPHHQGLMILTRLKA
jgi:hypothetical protein